MAEHTREHPILTPTPQRRRALRMKPETLAFAAALLGIIAAAQSAIPAISMVGLVPALLALAAGIAAMQLRTTRPGFAIAGVTLGALAVVVAISMSTSAG
ncbi:hypothetical protein ABIB15_001026 [Marisediminicola sp. UYEF4]|uniref:hypothetical protein n=1 Tax=Marisediminicola sp. UYEF4 TaxID=1756384 RepID=UPI00339A3A47